MENYNIQSEEEFEQLLGADIGKEITSQHDSETLSRNLKSFRTSSEVQYASPRTTHYSSSNR
jgi:hypothetical protein